MNDNVTPQGETQLSSGSSNAGGEVDLLEQLSEVEGNADVDAQPQDQSEQSDGAESEQDQTASAEDELVEWSGEDGKAYKVPKALHDGYLRQADYTRKTSELAQQRTMVEAQNTASAQIVQLSQAFPQVIARLTAAQADVQALSNTDWRQLQSQDPDAFNMRVAQLNLAKTQEQDAQRAFAQASQMFQDGLQKQVATAQEQAHRELSGNGQFSIKGWSEKVANEVTSYWAANGIPLDRLQKVTSAAEVSVLHDAMKYRQLKSQNVSNKQVGTNPVIAPKAQQILARNSNPQSRAMAAFTAKPSKDTLAAFLQNE